MASGNVEHWLGSLLSRDCGPDGGEGVSLDRGHSSGGLVVRVPTFGVGDQVGNLLDGLELVLLLLFETELVHVTEPTPVSSGAFS